MSASFSRTTRSLAADGSRRSFVGWALVAVLLTAWLLWFSFVDLTLYEVSESARLEVDQAAHPVATLVSGRLVAHHLQVGREVSEGEVLAELDVTTQQLRLDEEQTRLAALMPQLEAVKGEIAAIEQAQSQDHEAALAALDEARARQHEAGTAARLAEEELLRLNALKAGLHVPELELLRARAEAQKQRAAANAWAMQVRRLEWESRTRDSEGQARLEQLKREVARLEGQIQTTQATVERLYQELDYHSIRSPAAGRVGEVAPLQVGAVLEAGQVLGAVVPSGDLKVVADFLPPAALGRIQPGQAARLRLDGFPWTQYGSVDAIVSSVASEARDGRVRIELEVHPGADPRIPLQHGLPGQVEVAVERLTPAALVLRTAGRLLTPPSAPGNPQPGGAG